MNKEKYTLQEVTTPALEREWLDFPKRIYKGNRNWVCPLDVDVLEVFNPSKNELFADGEAIRRGMEAMDGRSTSDSGATGGGCWSRATNSSPSTRIPTIRPITRSCSKTMVLRIISISTVLSGG